jgi:hypothetical protein
MPDMRNTEKSYRAKRSRDKGGRREREMRNEVRNWDIPCDRIAQSGAYAKHQTGGGPDHDLDVWIFGINNPAWTAEVKARKDDRGFGSIKKWLGGNDLLFIIEDRSEPLVVMPFGRFKELAITCKPK